MRTRHEHYLAAESALGYLTAEQIDAHPVEVAQVHATLATVSDDVASDAEDEETWRLAHPSPGSKNYLPVDEWRDLADTVLTAPHDAALITARQLARSILAATE